MKFFNHSTIKIEKSKKRPYEVSWLIEKLDAGSLDQIRVFSDGLEKELKKEENKDRILLIKIICDQKITKAQASLLFNFAIYANIKSEELTREYRLGMPQDFKIADFHYFAIKKLTNSTPYYEKFQVEIHCPGKKRSLF